MAVLQGRGGGLLTTRTGERLRSLAPDWRWTGIGGASGWVDDPSRVLRDADVVVSNAGQGSVADIAALRRPAIVIPAERPFREQAATARVLESDDWPAIVLPEFPESGWPELLDRASALDGTRWHGWCDRRAAARFAEVVADVAGSAPIDPIDPIDAASVGLRSA